MLVENAFRTAKSILDTRPIYHKCDTTIQGHVFCSFLDLCLTRELELRLQGNRFLMRSDITDHASQAVRTAEVALPTVLQGIH